MLFCVFIGSVYYFVFCFSGRRRHTMCALVTGVQTWALRSPVLRCLRSPAAPYHRPHAGSHRLQGNDAPPAPRAVRRRRSPHTIPRRRETGARPIPADWTSVVKGKRVSVSVDLGGGRIIQKKKI